jgi:hypothetical protein
VREPDTAEFVAAARAATVKYQSQESAIADGFHPVGGDFPAMGEHWVSLPQVMADSFTASRPSVLTYIRVGGVPRLAGVAYTKLLAEREQPPAYAPARGHWHEHNGSIVEESFLAGHEPVPTDGAPRLAILHAWIWTPNPAGLFVTDNWSLPFARLGIAAPGDVTRDAARAAALVTDDEYYRTALTEGLTPTEAQRVRLDSTIEAHRRLAEEVTRAGAARGRLTSQEEEGLGHIWRDLWPALSTIVPERTTALGNVKHRVTGM